MTVDRSQRDQQPPIRRAIIEALGDGRVLSLTEVAQRLHQPKSRAHYHLKVLEALETVEEVHLNTPWAPGENAYRLRSL